MYNIVPSGGYVWLISPYHSHTTFEFTVDGTTNRAGSVLYDVSHSSASVIPVLYLSSDITLTGDGSSSNPYVITN